MGRHSKGTDHLLDEATREAAEECDCDCSARQGVSKAYVLLFFFFKAL